MSRADAVEVTVLRVGDESRSGAAIKVLVDRGKHGEDWVWLPLSAVHEIHRDDNPPRLVVDRWLADKEDLIS